MRNNIEVLTGIASFVDSTHVAVANSSGTLEYETKFVLIATGTKPATSPLVPINGRNIINSDQVLSMPEIPKTLIVVGGGVIGVEYTCMFKPRWACAWSSWWRSARACWSSPITKWWRLFLITCAMCAAPCASNEEVARRGRNARRRSGDAAEQYRRLRATRCYTRSGGRAMWMN